MIKRYTVMFLLTLLCLYFVKERDQNYAILNSLAKLMKIFPIPVAFEDIYQADSPDKLMINIFHNK
jgi:hypothetical protein